jgi:hypothetical protein
MSRVNQLKEKKRERKSVQSQPAKREEEREKERKRERKKKIARNTSSPHERVDCVSSAKQTNTQTNMNAKHTGFRRGSCTQC